jgi:hypothetical protein
VDLRPGRLATIGHGGPWRNGSTTDSGQSTSQRCAVLGVAGRWGAIARKLVGRAPPTRCHKHGHSRQPIDSRRVVDERGRIDPPQVIAVMAVLAAIIVLFMPLHFRGPATWATGRLSKAGPTWRNRVRFDRRRAGKDAVQMDRPGQARRPARRECGSALGMTPHDADRTREAQSRPPLGGPNRRDRHASCAQPRERLRPADQLADPVVGQKADVSSGLSKLVTAS